MDLKEKCYFCLRLDLLLISIFNSTRQQKIDLLTEKHPQSGIVGILLFSSCRQGNERRFFGVPGVESPQQYFSFLLSQKRLQEASLVSEQNLKDAEKELRYVVRYIKVSRFLFFLRLLWLQTFSPWPSSAALCGSGGRGEREDLLQTDPLGGGAQQPGQGADPAPGEGGRGPGREAAGEDPEGDGGAQESPRCPEGPL